MSDTTDGVSETESSETEQQQTEDTVDDLKAKLAKYQDIAKTQEKRAKENSAAAKRLAEIEESQKSEAQKAADKVAAAEAEVASVPAKVSEALKSHLVALHGIDNEDSELFLTATEPELLLKQVDRLVGSSGKRKNHVPREGESKKPANTEEAAFVRELFGG